MNIVRKDFQHSKRESILVEHRNQSIRIESIFSYRHNRILQDRRVRLSEYQILFDTEPVSTIIDCL